MATKQKTRRSAEPDPPAVDAFGEAERIWRAHESAWNELLQRRDKLRGALSLVASGDDDKDRTEGLRNFVGAELLELARTRPRKVQDELQEVELQIEEGLAEHREAVEAWHAAQRREANRLARELQPKHREAVEAIAAALEKLSVAITAEREVRDELARTAPLPTSAYLPDMSSDLLIGALAESDSPASAWARNARQLGILR